MLIASIAIAQDRVTLNVSQDLKFLVTGDSRGNDAGTPDIVLRSEWQGKQSSIGYLFVAPEFEYASLQGGDYRRYSLNAGYTFTVLNWLEFSASAGYGIIDRRHIGADFSPGAQLEAVYKISDGFKIFYAWQWVERSDLYEYGSPTRGSGFIGVKIGIFKTRGR